MCVWKVDSETLVPTCSTVAPGRARSNAYKLNLERLRTVQLVSVR